MTWLSGARQRRIVIVAAIALLWLMLMAGASEYLRGSESRTRHSIVQRLQTRIEAGGEMASLDVSDILARQRTQARTWLAGADPSERQLRLAAGAVGARQAILLDGHGEVVRDQPALQPLHGVDIALAYPYLAHALAGRSAVSGVVPDTMDGAPVVAFAVPFDSASGRRVFGVSFAVSQTPLRAVAANLLTTPGHHVYLLDQAGLLVAGASSSRVGTSLTQRDPSLAAALRRVPQGAYSGSHGERVFVSAPVAGTPWRLAASVPASQLFSSIDGPGRALAWLVLACLTVAGLVIIVIGARFVRSRQQLIVLAAELDRLARVDGLTGVSNRRHLEESLAAAASAADRGRRPLSVLMVDIDHFKNVNDTLGHHAGDAVLVAAANVMRSTLRLSDSLGRWGGEEFLAILPDTGLDAAVHTAERLRAAMRATLRAGEAPVTVTIGVAALDHTGIAPLLSRADAALYAGKAAGRDTVRVAASARSETHDRPPAEPLAPARSESRAGV